MVKTTAPGYESAVLTLVNEIRGYFINKDSYQHLQIPPPQAIYVSGVPGVGKSTVMNCALAQLAYPVIRGDMGEIVGNAVGTDIADMYISMAFDDLADRARATAPSVILLDGLDVLGDSELTEDITDLPGSFVRFAEQIPQDVVLVMEVGVDDAAIPTSIKRCQALQHKLLIPLPRQQQREAIVKHALGKFILTKEDALPTTAEVLARQVANATAGYVARDISNLCRQAVLRSLRSCLVEYTEDDSDELTQRLERLELAESMANSSLYETQKGQTPALPSWKHFEDSLQTTQPSQQLEFESVRPSKRWADIGGYEPVKQALQRFMQLATSETPLKLGIKPPSGILLHGPSGCGKTAMALAMIGESTCNVMNIRGYVSSNSELFSKYLGETEARLRRLFQAARAAAPCIVFIDEVDSIASKRGWSSIESGGPALRVLSTLLNEMDGVHDTSGVAVVGCTNQLDKIDDAIVRPGRFDNLVEILLPSADDRAGILQVLAQRSPLASDVHIDTLSKATDGYSGAALEKLFREAGLAALRSNRDAAALRMDDFVTALDRMHVQI
ncbi:hypothetical protein H4R20_002450 [Coemansia guatemalensis]|uniref:AAA+ ATPase domain-containing protein n=1 Tax=Coemansia guatemalensis TaxID=2761395 RepID=A0A9W8HX74_9FUNG|nr:hypothetical protein H4R20_002450 [Coemansia guatemalensis]